MLLPLGVDPLSAVLPPCFKSRTKYKLGGGKGKHAKKNKKTRDKKKKNECLDWRCELYVGLIQFQPT